MVWYPARLEEPEAPQGLDAHALVRVAAERGDVVHHLGTDRIIKTFNPAEGKFMPSPEGTARQTSPEGLLDRARGDLSR